MILTQPILQADLSHSASTVFVGATTPGAVSDVVLDCEGWTATTTSDKAYYGKVYNQDDWFGWSVNGTCGTDRYIYCLEERE